MATEHADNAHHAEHALTPSGYIEHHLSFNAQPVAEGSGFWTLHVDTFVMSVVLGLLVMGLVWLVARKASAGVPTKGQAFVELVFGFIDDQVKNIFHGNRHSFIAPQWIGLRASFRFLAVQMLNGVPYLLQISTRHLLWRYPSGF